MKAQLREHVRVPGEGNTRNVEGEVDWDRRVVWLGGHAVPFENVAIMDFQLPPGQTGMSMFIPAGATVARVSKIVGGDSATITLVRRCDRCGAEFASPQKLGGHRRHCKGQ